MKHKIFLFSIIALIAIGSVALANYVEPTSTAPNNNTGIVLKTGPDEPVRMFEKIGTANGAPLTWGPFANMGLYSDKFIAIGASVVSDNLIVSSKQTGSLPFDQYSNNTNGLLTYDDPNTNGDDNITPKPLEAFITGRYFSKLFITIDSSLTPKYDLELRASSGFSPTTNFGLGDYCELYPNHLGKQVVPDGNGNIYGGCFGGFKDSVNNIYEYDIAYMSMYKPPSWTGTLSSINNTNNQVVGRCTFFNPSTSPTNLGPCYTAVIGKPSVSLAITNHQCIYTINLSDITKFKNPKIGIAWVSGPQTPSYTASPTSSFPFTVSNGLGTGFSQIDSSEYCNHNSITWKAYVVDDYGQYSESESPWQL
jgi:hypothetical protein